MEKWENVSAAPHIRGGMSTARIMQLVLVALLPTTVFGIVNFGTRAFLHILICIVTCVLTEFTIEAFGNLPLTAGDFSAVVTGLLLALTLPVNAPLWIGVIGSIFAIALIKICFGGLGKNKVNPALAGRLLLMLLFAKYMGDFTCDAYSGATPMEALLAGQDVDPFPMLLGTTGGCIGETSAIAILAGAIILLAFGIVNLRIPLSCLLSFAVVLTLFGGRGFDEIYLASHICGGGFLLGTWFMATDYVTSPVTRKGQCIYGAVIGIVAAFIRIQGNLGEGMTFAILAGNLLVPLIEKYTMPKAFGRKKPLISR